MSANANTANSPTGNDSTFVAEQDLIKQWNSLTINDDPSLDAAINYSDLDETVPTSQRRFPASPYTTNGTSGSRTGPQNDICSFYQRGHCRHGTRCRFRHINGRNANGTTAAAPRPHSIPVDCRYWVNTGECRFGSQCRYQHIPEMKALGLDPLSDDSESEAERVHTAGQQTGAGNLVPEGEDADADVSSLGASSSTANSTRPRTTAATIRRPADSGHMPTSTTTCRYWASSGRCRWADRCRFRHDPETRGRHNQPWMAGDIPEPEARMLQQLMSAAANGLVGDLLDGVEGEEEEGEEDMGDMMGACGFTADEVLELLSQGVKPWDEDAWEVMFALRNMDDDDYECDGDYYGYVDYKDDDGF